MNMFRTVHNSTPIYFSPLPGAYTLILARSNGIITHKLQTFYDAQKTKLLSDSIRFDTTSYTYDITLLCFSIKSIFKKWLIFALGFNTVSEHCKIFQQHGTLFPKCLNQESTLHIFNRIVIFVPSAPAALWDWEEELRWHERRNPAYNENFIVQVSLTASGDAWLGKR